MAYNFDNVLTDGPTPLSNHELIRQNLIDTWGKGYGKTPAFAEALYILANPGKWIAIVAPTDAKRPMSSFALLDSCGACFSEKFKTIDGKMIRIVKLSPGIHNLITPQKDKLSLSKEEIARFFGCTIDQLNQQYADNTAILKKMHAKAKRTGKKESGFTEQELDAAAKRFEAITAADSTTKVASI